MTTRKKNKTKNKFNSWVHATPKSLKSDKPDWHGDENIPCILNCDALFACSLLVVKCFVGVVVVVLAFVNH